MGQPVDGLLVLDKPAAITSRTAVDRAQRWLPRRTRLGHAGTLDPLATGVLVLCAGSATRLIEYVQRMDKVYRARLRLGARSSTDDADGDVEPVSVALPPGRSDVARCLAGFVGEIEQVPPAFSAAKIAGRRAYALARRGEPVAVSPRRVRVYGIDLLSYHYPSAELEIRCGKGTYVRSLARDLGERLGCGGLVERLRRTRVGPFTEEDALALDATGAEARARLRPARDALVDLPWLRVPADLAWRLRQGQAVPPPEGTPASPAAGEIEFAVFDPGGGLVGVAAMGHERRLRPERILPTP